MCSAARITRGTGMVTGKAGRTGRRDARLSVAGTPWHPYYSVSPSASELGGQQCCEKVHWPMHDDHPRETTRPQIDELKDYDQWQKLQETKYD
jgi:hypothetical protein